MAGPTVAQVAKTVEDLTQRLQQLEAEHKTHREVTELRLKNAEQQLADRVRAEEELRNRVTDLAAKNATLEERSRNQEKTSDRGWQLWLAALGFGFGLLSLLVTAALQLKK